MAVIALEIVELGKDECNGHARGRAWQTCQRCEKHAAQMITLVKENRRERLRRCAGHGRELVERFMRG